MKCYIENILSDQDVTSDIKVLIPDGGLRRRMSRVIKTAISTAIECAGGVDGIKNVDSIITATGFGCLTDSEKFLRNIITEREQLLNPTPFIQSTFNTIGGQIALLAHNQCYNVTYVDRSHSFEDALLDGMLRIKDQMSSLALVGSYDEQTLSQHKIMERMGAYRIINDGEGCIFIKLTSAFNKKCIAQITQVDFLNQSISSEECQKKYATTDDSTILYNDFGDNGLYPTVSAKVLLKAVRLIAKGAQEVVIYNSYWSKKAYIIVIQCI